MPLTVQQLNADTTLLLTFTAPVSSAVDNEKQLSCPVTVLLDPWLTGPSPIFHSSFAVSRHTTESVIQTLAELIEPAYREPDLVIVSQSKTDHCNQETLCTLPASWKGTIVAVPAAAKRIKSWKRFAESQVQVIPSYNVKQQKSVWRLPVSDNSNTQAAGEITITNIPEPYDLSAVHNALGITYHPPPSPTGARPLSVLYTPHGLASHLLAPYLEGHLRSRGALPVDLLVHSLNIEANPKWMGGVVSNGAPGGLPVAKMLHARHWLAAHDEEKDNRGIATKLIRCVRYGAEEVEEMLRGEGVRGTMVHRLGVGETFTVDETFTSDGEEGSTGRGNNQRDRGD